MAPLGGGTILFFQIANIISSSFSTFWYLFFRYSDKKGKLEGFCPIGLFSIFSSNFDIISSTFSTFLAGNQVGWDQNQT